MKKVVHWIVIICVIFLSIIIVLNIYKLCYGEEIELGPARSMRLKEKADGLYCISLYSKIANRKQGEDKRRFLKDGYEYIKIIEEGGDKLKILEEKAKVLKAVMKAEGVPGIEAYYDVMFEIVQIKNRVQEAERNYEEMVTE